MKRQIKPKILRFWALSINRVWQQGIKKNRKELTIKSLRFNKVLRAGLEPARTLLFTGF